MVAIDETKMNMAVVLLVLLLALSPAAGAASQLPEALGARATAGGGVLKSATFLSPPFFLRPGDVSDKYFHDVAFPRGHVALKSFNGEVVDARGAAVPLHEVYLHHWVLRRYFAAAAENATAAAARWIPARNAGVCEGDTHGQYYGLGSETRRTATWVPDPFAVEAGDPAAPPAGYAERWMLNVHAIDTRGAADRNGCTECRCDLYNVTPPADRPGYAGGTLCCYDGARCKVEEQGFAGAGDGEVRKLFFRYTVVWLDWSDVIVPVRIYIFDVTHRPLPVGCKVEYQVEECNIAEKKKRAHSECVHVKVTNQVVPRGGDLVYAVAHQHAGGVGSSLHGEDGRVLCESTPVYGGGVDAGDEKGYIVGMSTCYPKPGTVRVRDGEVLTVVSNYSSKLRHTGVMGLFYVLVADEDRRGKQQQQTAALSSDL